MLRSPMWGLVPVQARVEPGRSADISASGCNHQSRVFSPVTMGVSAVVPLA